MGKYGNSMFYVFSKEPLLQYLAVDENIEYFYSAAAISEIKILQLYFSIDI